MIIRYFYSFIKLYIQWVRYFVIDKFLVKNYQQYPNLPWEKRISLQKYRFTFRKMNSLQLEEYKITSTLQTYLQPSLHIRINLVKHSYNGSQQQFNSSTKKYQPSVKPFYVDLLNLLFLSKLSHNNQTIVTTLCQH
jgi:hypothetical protein